MFEYFKELREYKKELKKRYLQKKYLLKKDCDWGMLEDLIQQCNQNPNLTITVKLGDGTVLDLKTTSTRRSTNPLFTDRAYQE